MYDSSGSLTIAIFFNQDSKFSFERFILVQLHTIIGLGAGINKGKSYGF